MKLIRFHGHLNALYPDGIKVEGDSAAECISALQFYPGFRESDGVTHQVILPAFGSRDALYDKTDQEIIEVHPLVEGAGGKVGMYLQIIIGVVLIATGWGAGAGTTVLGMSGSTAVMMGAMMVLGGITSLLMPQPKLDTTGTENNRSNYLSANKNTVKIGTRIPLIFGRRKWYGHYLSFNVTAMDKSPVIQPMNNIASMQALVQQYEVTDYQQYGGDA